MQKYTFKFQSSSKVHQKFAESSLKVHFCQLSSISRRRINFRYISLPIACKNYEFLIENCLDGVVERDARPPTLLLFYSFTLEQPFYS